MAIDDVYQLTINSTISGQVYMNTIALRRTIDTAVVGADFQPPADALKNIHRPSQSSFYSYTTWRARQVRGTAVTWPEGPDCTPIGGLWFEGVFTAPTSGVTSDHVLPQQCAMVTTLRTNTVGRRYRGRLYAAGFGEDSQNAGSFSAPIVAAIQAAWNAFFTTYVTDAATNGWELGIWSYRIASGCAVVSPGGGHVRVEDANPAAAFTRVSAPVTRSAVYTQRRRVVGVGI